VAPFVGGRDHFPSRNHQVFARIFLGRSGALAAVKTIDGFDFFDDVLVESSSFSAGIQNS
jgi:hypothetical protein